MRMRKYNYGELRWTAQFAICNLIDLRCAVFHSFVGFVISIRRPFRPKGCWATRLNFKLQYIFKVTLYTAPRLQAERSEALTIALLTIFSNFSSICLSKIKTPGSGNAIPLLGVKLKRLVWLLFKIDWCSATSMESSPRSFKWRGWTEQSILKNNQKTYYPRLVSLPKQV